MYGIETEYGIHVDGMGASDMLAEARAVVRAYKGRFASPWNYGAENPRRDMRGFDVRHLTRDATDAQFDKSSATFRNQSDERSDRVLANGARLYNDHGHPEYATPECRDVFDLVAHDRAGERIVWECAQRHAETGEPVTIYKNNTDFHGASYGCHESYLVSRAIPYASLEQALIPFLVTRQIVAGAGKVGLEPASRSDCGYQLSQRADFVTEAASVDTLAKRPILNTRDEPHADPGKYRRLHVIVGDANMCETSTALKVGSLALVIRLLEAGWRPAMTLRDPVKAIRDVSRDPRRKWLVEMDGKSTMSAVDIQRVYCEEALKVLEDLPDDLCWAGREWLRTLDALERDPMSLADRLDWVAKLRLLEEFRAEEGLGWDDPLLRSLDLAYSDVDPENGLYYGLEQDGHVTRFTDEDRILRAMDEPPGDTRAAVRGAFVKRFAESIESVSWGGVVLSVGAERVVVELGVSGPQTSASCAAKVLAAATEGEAVAALSS